jgi:tRNA (guanine37-N1)-methyltransferase
VSSRTFTHAVAHDLAATSGFSLLCGRYEGIDQRAIDLVVGDEVWGGGVVVLLRSWRPAGVPPY